MFLFCLNCSVSKMVPKGMSSIRIETPVLREFLAEFLGTFILVVSRHAAFTYQLTAWIILFRRHSIHALPLLCERRDTRT